MNEYQRQKNIEAVMKDIESPKEKRIKLAAGSSMPVWEFYAMIGIWLGIAGLLSLPHIL